jgi:TRAP-type mannitol/chloroaromatic compound transport system permease large subunit
MNMHISYLSPPFAPAAFYMKSITPPEITMTQIYVATLPYLWLTFVATLLVILFPQLSLWLVHLAR